MTGYAVITENDESPWEDRTGVLYHFPSRYAKYPEPGTQVIYYKGRLKDRSFADKRLSDEPHYFALAEIGPAWPDLRSKKGDLFAQISNYRPFDAPVLAKQDGSPIESIPQTRVTNHWRDGVRQIEEDVFLRVQKLATLSPVPPIGDELNDTNQGSEGGFESGVEGQSKQRYVTLYERDRGLRKAAIALHGTTCRACDFDFEQTYGEAGAGYTQVHHRVPVSTLGGSTLVNPATDLVPVCANCHAIIHRKQGKTLSVEELRAIVESRKAK